MSWTAGLEHFIREAEVLAPYTWLHLGGPAEFFAEPTTVEELSELVRRCCEQEIAIRVLGGGSNLLIPDEGIPGVVVHLAAPVFQQISVKRRLCTAGGGAKLGHVVSASVREGLAGLVQLVGIPGTIGGGLRGNAASHAGDLGQWTHSATVMTRSGEVLVRSRDELVFGYRKSSLDELVILGAEFELEEADPAELTKQMQKLWILRRSSQPQASEHMACAFKNPSGITAASLIEQVGLKGSKEGEAEISDRNANFIITRSGATFRDVQKLMQLMSQRVRDSLGIELEPEITVW